MEVKSTECCLPQGSNTPGILSGGILPDQDAGGRNVPNTSSNTQAGGALDRNYLEGLCREREALGIGPGMELTRRLLNQEIERVQNGGKPIRSDDKKMSDITKDKSIKLTVRALVPVKDHPKFNFVGKLLGPKGNSLKRLQEETMTKMAILGRGSMREKEKEEELRLSGDAKFNHLSEDLHVEVTAVAPPAEAHARIAYALTEIRRYLVPDYNDEIRQEQMREMQIINKNAGSPSQQTEAESISKGDAMSCSEDEASPPPPPTTTEAHQSSPPQKENINEKKPTQQQECPPVIPQQHPALRGNRNEAKKNTSRQVRTSRGPAGSRRSVLSLLAKARAIQQKEQDFMGVFQDIAAGYSVYEHLAEIPMSETEDISAQTRPGGALKMRNTPADRARFRHDPYPRIAT